MLRMRLAAALVAVLALTACSNSDNLTAPSGSGTRDNPVPGPRDSGLPGTSGGDTTTTNPGDTTSTNPGDTTFTSDTTGAGDPVNNGTWTSPGDSTPPTIEPVDPAAY